MHTQQWENKSYNQSNSPYSHPTHILQHPTYKHILMSQQRGFESYKFQFSNGTTQYNTLTEI